MAEYRKFTLQPGQQAPLGSTGKTLKTGEIVFYGDDFPSEINSQIMTQDEIDWFENEPLENEKLKIALTDLVDNLKFADVDVHIENVFGSLSAAQQNSLKKLYKAVLCIGKLS